MLPIIDEGGRLQQLFGNLTTNEALDVEEIDNNKNTQQLVPICTQSSFISKSVEIDFSEAIEMMTRI